MDVQADGFGVHDAFSRKGKMLVLCWVSLSLAGWYAPCLICALSEALSVGVHFMMKIISGRALVIVVGTEVADQRLMIRCGAGTAWRARLVLWWPAGGGWYNRP